MTTKDARAKRTVRRDARPTRALSWALAVGLFVWTAVVCAFYFAQFAPAAAGMLKRVIE